MQRYFDYYDGVGWTTSKGQNITDKVAYARGWKPLGTRPLDKVTLAGLRQLYEYAVTIGKNSPAKVLSSFIRSTTEGSKCVLIYSSRKDAVIVEQLIAQLGINDRYATKHINY